MSQVLLAQKILYMSAEAAGDPAAGNPLMGIITLLFPLLMLGVLYFIMIRPQRKQEKKLSEQRKNLVVGDEIVTIGGLKGRIVNIKDDEITISSSVAGTLVTFTRDAIGQVIKPQGDVV